MAGTSTILDCIGRHFMKREGKTGCCLRTNAYLRSGGGDGEFPSSCGCSTVCTSASIVVRSPCFSVAMIPGRMRSFALMSRPRSAWAVSFRRLRRASTQTDHGVEKREHIFDAVVRFSRQQSLTLLRFLCSVMSINCATCWFGELRGLKPPGVQDVRGARARAPS